MMHIFEREKVQLTDLYDRQIIAHISLLNKLKTNLRVFMFPDRGQVHMCSQDSLLQLMYWIKN